MGLLRDKLARALEVIHVIATYAPDLASRRALLTCYASLLASPTSREEVAFRLRIRGQRFPFRMRKSDIFTLGEVFHGRST